MVQGIRVKVCGLTRVEDVVLAEKLGADFLGFIFYPRSPRHMPLERFKELRGQIPLRKSVAVLVEPSLTEVGAAVAAGAQILQVHFALERQADFVPWLTRTIDPERLWLAPKTPAPAALPRDLLDAGKYFLIDAYAKDKFGGTGHTGDWEGFAKLRKEERGRCFILSGGLNSANIAEALSRTNACWLDVNSGVESAPGLKDAEKLRAFFGEVARARAAATS
jgi:phosphoribosylanthranilate isomerase